VLFVDEAAGAGPGLVDLGVAGGVEGDSALDQECYALTEFEGAAEECVCGAFGVEGDCSAFSAVV
jgi:hypothetical protein